ncbi:hypothetical protein P2318_16385 [Myxococcaceae bacterium GXIMD 01537]
MSLTRRWFGLLLTCALLAGAPAAQAQSKEFKRRINAATRLYEALEYEKALEQLKRAKALPLSADDNARVAILQGLVLADLGKQEEARAQFVEGLSLNPEARLPFKVSPKVERLFEDVRASTERGLARLEAADESRRLEQERREAERKTAEAARIAAATPPAPQQPPRVDAPATPPAQPAVTAVTVAPPAPREPAQEALAPRPEVRVRRSMPITPFVLAGAAAVAGGLSGYFGMASQSQVTEARGALFQDDTLRHLDSANSNALAANMLMGAAGAALAASVITFFTMDGDEVVTSARENDR